MAMRGRGQIRELARIAVPDIGVITNIAPVHLELVGTVDGVAAAKAELIDELSGGTAVVPTPEPLLDRHVGRFRGRVVTFGGPEADVHLVLTERRGAAGERWFPGVDECIAALPGPAPAGSAVLVKASRLLRLERVAEALAAGGPASPADSSTSTAADLPGEDDDA